MTPQVQQINVKPDTPGEVGLPKMAVELANVTVSGIDGDYNRFRKKKKNNEIHNYVLKLSLSIVEEILEKKLNINEKQNLIDQSIDELKIALKN